MLRIALILSVVALPVLGDQTYPNGRTIECYCTDRNHNRVELGETICMQVGGRMFMAQCQMSLNVPMWREIRDGCLSSGLRLRRGDQPLQSRAVDAQI